MLQWIIAINGRKKIGIYLSDIAGAFDRVFTPYLLKYLKNAGIAPTMLKLLESYLSPRTARVVVSGAMSE